MTTGQANTVTAAAATIITSSDSTLKLAQPRRQYCDNDVHPNLAAVPGYRAAAREYTTDHQEQHDLFGPWDRYAEEVTADDVYEIDPDARDQKYRRRRAGDSKKPANACYDVIEHCGQAP